MLRIVADGAHATAKGDTELVLLNENNKPTPTLLGLVALELAIDITIAYAAYRLFKAFNG